MNRKVKLSLMMLIMFVALGSAFAEVTPMCGFRVSGNTSFLTTDGVDAFGYGGEAEFYLGGDISFHNGFFGEIGTYIEKPAIDMTTFAGLKTPVGITLGGGWVWSPGAGWSLGFSGGFASVYLSSNPDVWEMGMYASFVPRFAAQPLEEYYALSISFPITVVYTNNTFHTSIGVSFGGDVSFYGGHRESRYRREAW